MKRSLSLLDPELLEFVREFPDLPVGNENLEALRDWPADPPAPPPAPEVSEILIPGPAGHPEIRALKIDPGGEGPDRPAFLHMHGGGYVMGSPEMAVTRLQEYAAESGALIISPAYRLAPETPFPGALEDNYASLLWLHSQAEELGIDSTRISVGGESAGGGHAASLAIAARDRGGPSIAFQFLVYPMLDDRSGITIEVPSHIGQHVWTRKNNEFGWSSYLGVSAGSESVPDGSVPSRIDNLSGLPPAFIAVGGLDLFVTENILYSNRLIQAGIQTELYVQPAVFHGSNKLVPDAQSSVEFNSRLMEAFVRGVGGAEK